MLLAGPVLGEQTCKYDSIAATAPASRFTDNGDGTVTDKVTELEWKRCSEGQTWDGATCTGSAAGYYWQGALQRADGADYAGQDDWRLPNNKELASIVERACYGPSIDLAVFPRASGNFWSSSPSIFDAEHAWYVDLVKGLHRSSSKSFAVLYVRLVRGGQASGPLNDTGIDWCANNSTNYLACPVVGYSGQDAENGRDVTQDDDADGHAGFAFTKLDANGKALPASATSWSCVRDNVTGLIWEGKTDDGGLHDEDWTYTWYNPDQTGNGGSAGTPDGTDNCWNSTRCDTHSFVADVNRAGLCGASDWRMPTLEELRDIVDIGRFGSDIGTVWFIEHHSGRRTWHVSASIRRRKTVTTAPAGRRHTRVTVAPGPPRRVR